MGEGQAEIGLSAGYDHSHARVGATGCEKKEIQRELIRELSEKGRSVSELSRLYGVSRKTIHQWKKRYEQEGLGLGTEESTSTSKSATSHKPGNGRLQTHAAKPETFKTGQQRNRIVSMERLL